MRIGLVTPTLNGIGLGQTTVDGIIADTLASVSNNLPFQIQQGTVASPSDLAANLAQQVQAVCRNWPEQCVNAQSAIDAAVAQYSLMLEQARANAQQPAPVVYPSLPTPQYVPPPTNALDRVTPQQVNVNPSQPLTVLSPPTPKPPVPATNDGSFTASKATATGKGFFSEVVTIGGMDIPVVLLLAAGGFALFMMGHKGR